MKKGLRDKVIGRKDAIVKGAKTNLEDLLNDLDNSILKRKKFSYAAIRKAAKNFSAYMQDSIEKEDNNEMMKLFFNLYGEVYADRERSTGRFHPSSVLGDCPRKIYYEFTEEVSEDHHDDIPNTVAPSLQRIFDTGTWWHTYIQFHLYRAGYLIEAEAPVKSIRRRLDGRADGKLLMEIEGKETEVILEIKTINAFQFSKIKEAPIEKHEAQAGTYADHLGIDWILYLYINKDTCEIYPHLIKPKEALVKQVNRKMSSILESVKLKEAPDRICKTPNAIEARKCLYCTHCFKQG